MSSDDSHSKRDLVFLHSPSEDGEGMRVIRAREDAIEVGEVRPVKEGAPIQGDLVRLKQRKEHSRLFDVETLLATEQAGSAARKGPAKVATRSFREHWDTIFAAPRKNELLN